MAIQTVCSINVDDLTDVKIAEWVFNDDINASKHKSLPDAKALENSD